jgi:hypothetical protein
MTQRTGWFEDMVEPAKPAEDKLIGGFVSGDEVAGGHYMSGSYFAAAVGEMADTQVEAGRPGLEIV